MFIAGQISSKYQILIDPRQIQYLSTFMNKHQSNQRSGLLISKVTKQQGYPGTKFTK